MTPLRIIYFGTPTFAAIPLRALSDDPRFQVLAVVTQPGKPAGRGKATVQSPVAAFAAERGITILQPDTLREAGSIAPLQALDADLFVVDAYGKILPPAVLALPRHGCVNLHPSLLPKHRGATPVPFTILAGETETGMTVMRMSEGMDEGDILSVIHEPVLPSDTAATLLDRLNTLASGRIGDILCDVVEGRITPRPQDHAAATYSRLLTKEDGRINWSDDTALMIERRARAFTPWPGIFTFFQGKRLKVLACAVGGQEAGQAVAPGTFIAPDLVVTKAGSLRLVTVQPEGRSPMPFSEFLRGIHEKELRFE